MSTQGSGASRAGGEGLHNEDAFVVEEGLGLYVVCDGASGTPAGEVAARVASGAVEAAVAESDGRIGPRVVERAMHGALQAVAEAERTDPAFRGLSTTLTMLLAHGRLGVFGHTGDSRAYLFRGRRAQQLTVDHELTRPASSGGGEAACDVFALDLEPGDTIVLCTDGAENVVRDDGMVRVAGTLSPRLLASRIVAEAHRRRPELDATAVVVRVKSERERGWLELSVPDRGTEHARTLELR